MGNPPYTNSDSLNNTASSSTTGIATQQINKDNPTNIGSNTNFGSNSTATPNNAIETKVTDRVNAITNWTTLALYYNSNQCIRSGINSIYAQAHPGYKFSSDITSIWDDVAVPQWVYANAQDKS